MLAATTVRSPSPAASLRSGVPPDRRTLLLAGSVSREGDLDLDAHASVIVGRPRSGSVSRQVDSATAGHIRLPRAAGSRRAGWVRVPGAGRRSRLRANQPNRGRRRNGLARHGRMGFTMSISRSRLNSRGRVARRWEAPWRMVIVGSAIMAAGFVFTTSVPTAGAVPPPAGAIVVGCAARSAARSRPAPDIQGAINAARPSADHLHLRRHVRPATDDQQAAQRCSVREHGVDARPGRSRPGRETVFDVPAGAIVYGPQERRLARSMASRCGTPTRRGERHRQRARPGLHVPATTSSRQPNGDRTSTRSGLRSR